MYLRQVRRAGILGLVGYLLFSVGLLVMLSIAFVGGYVLPSLADIARLRQRRPRRGHGRHRHR